MEQSVVIALCMVGAVFVIIGLLVLLWVCFCCNKGHCDRMVDKTTIDKAEKCPKAPAVNGDSSKHPEARTGEGKQLLDDNDTKMNGKDDHPKTDFDIDDVQKCRNISAEDYLRRYDRHPDDVV